MASQYFRIASGIVSRPGLAGLLLLFACAILPATALAQGQERLRASLEDGFARLILSFDEEIPVDVRISAGVVVVTYSEPVTFDVRRLPQQLPDYISAARSDPDQRGVRFALAGPYRVNTIEAADRLVVDLLPENWEGPPPELPDFILAELRARAEQTENARLKRERERRIADAEPIEVRVARLPTFTRLTFAWPEPVKARLTREDALVEVVFDEAAKVELGVVKTRLPEWVTEIEAGADERGGLKITLNVDAAVNVRGFPEDATYVVDVTNPDWAGDANPLSVTGAEDITDAALSVAGSEDGGSVPPAVLAESPLQSRQSSLSPEGAEPLAEVATSPRQDVIEASGPIADTPLSSPNAEQQALLDRQRQLAIEAQPNQVEEPASATLPDSTGRTSGPADPAVEQPAMAPAVPLNEGQDNALPKRADLDTDAVQARVEVFGTARKIIFPFDQPVAAAVFRRSGALWIVFDTDEAMATDAIARDLDRELRTFEQDFRDGRHILRLDFVRPKLVTAEADASHWNIIVGDTIFEPPQPMVLDRRAGEDGRPEIVARFESASRASEMTDPESGETFWVATGFAPESAVIKPQRFVDFESETTSHGVVVRPIADDLDVRIETGFVVIGSESGLALSGEVNRSFEAASGALGEISRPGFIAVEPERMRDEKGMGAVLMEQAAAVAALPQEERSAARLRLAKLYLASDLAAEGLGMLRYAAELDPAIRREPSYRALFGVSQVMMGRHSEALQSFDNFKLGHSPDIALWRGLAHAGLSQWRQAEVALLDGEAAVPSYSPERQIKLRLAGARAAIQTGDFEAATRFLGQAEALVGSLDANPELLLLWGWLAERMGRDEQALAAYARLSEIDDRKVQSEALLRDTDLKFRRGDIDAEGAIQAYETLALTWRGDSIELETLRSLAEVYADTGDYRRAFEVMKHAAISDTGSPITREIEDKMNAVFIDLFIGARAEQLEPLQALALFYDFRELTPVGRQGDEVIRALADRLIEVDLLDQAAALLEHQVDNRLTGAARAQIATKLALVHLMNRKPEQALQVLARTRQAVLPEGISKQRIILEARALAETGRADLAVDLLGTVDGDDVLRLTADALWRGEKWQQAAEALERLLAATWSPDVPLTEALSYDVMRTAIAYALAEDELGTGRIRAKFGPAMADTPEAHAFSIVTGEDTEISGDFREVVRSIAAIDTLESFLADYRARFSTGGTEAEG